MEIKLIDGVYKSLLRTAGLDVTSDYFVRMNIGNKEFVPVTKGGRQMVLPVSEQLRHPEVGNRLVFHPLSDNSLTKDSEILTFYRHILINRLNVVYTALGSELLRIAASPAMHGSMSPDQQEFLRAVPDADQRSIDDYEAIGAAASKANQLQNAFVTIYLKKGVPLNGKAYQRIAAVNFPFYKELLDWEEEDKIRKENKTKKAKAGEHQIYDVGVRVKDRETLKGIMQYLIPNVATPHALDIGSNSQIAPGLDAMMRAFMPLAGHLNAIIELFEGLIPDVADMAFDTEWVTAFDNLDVLWTQIRSIPEQSHHVAETPVAAAPQPKPPAPPPWDGGNQGAYQPPQPAYAAPVQPNHPPRPQQQPGQSGGTGGGVALRDLLRNQQQPGYFPQQQNAGPGYPPGGGYSPYGQPQQGFPQGMGYPGQPQQPQYTPPYVQGGRRY